MLCWIVFQIQFIYVSLFQTWKVTVVSQMSRMVPVIILIHCWHQIYTQHIPKPHTHVIHQKIRWLLVQTNLAVQCFDENVTPVALHHLHYHPLWGPCVVRGPVDGRFLVWWVIENVVWTDSWLSIAGAGCGLTSVGAAEEQVRKVVAGEASWCGEDK
jgi:hypothetical protein